MDKKIKLDELGKEKTQVLDKSDLTREVTRVSLNDLDKENTGVIDKKDLTRQIPKVSLQELKESKTGVLKIPEKKTEALKVEELRQKPSQKTKIPSAPTKEKVKEVEKVIVRKEDPKKEQVSFERSFLNLYIAKIFGFLKIAVLMEVVAHFLKFYEEKDVWAWETVDSYLYGDDLYFNIAKLIAFLGLAFIMTPNEKVTLNNLGIICNKVRVVNIFFNSETVFLKWEDIHSVKYKIELFEGFLFFYDKDQKVLGQIDFSLKSQKDFFAFVGKHAGKHHPLYLVRKEIDLNLI